MGFGIKQAWFQTQPPATASWVIFGKLGIFSTSTFPICKLGIIIPMSYFGEHFTYQ